MSHLTPLHEAAATVVAEIAGAGVRADAVKVDVPRQAEMGDLAVNTFPFAKATGKNPAALAGEVVAAFKPNDLIASAAAAGPYINFKANRPAVFKWLVGAALQSTLLPREYGKGQTICIDYSSPNVSKHLAYHHIRSTMLGHSLVQIFRALGYTVVGINHLGDWGTTHGKLIAAWKMYAAGAGLSLDTVDVTALNDLYTQFNEAAKTDTTLEDVGRAAFKKLEDGDAESVALWQRFKEISLAEYQTVYDLLGVKFDLVKGESEFMPDVDRVIGELAQKGLSSESEGALVVVVEGERNPLMLRKSDDATTYATRDLPAAEFRWNTWHFARSLYVVDRGQSEHFRQLFGTLKAMGHEWANKLQHIPFGLVQIVSATGEIEKTGSRKGNVVLLKNVVAEAKSRVQTLLAEINPELQGAELERVSEQVGLGAVLFANLSSQRDKDVKFDWDRVIALTGDSGPYAQYSHARCAGILRKAGGFSKELDLVDFSKLTTELEWAVARKLWEFPQTVVSATPKCEPHVIAHYLLDLAGDLSRWYTAGNSDASLKVLCEDQPTREARVALVAATKVVIAEALHLLGLAAPETM
ncbi:MAG: arginine--tRNA ligase [Kofleriaceae bacterium]